MDCAHSMAVGSLYELAKKDWPNADLCSRRLVSTSWAGLGTFSDFSCSVCTTGVVRVVFIEKLEFNDITCERIWHFSTTFYLTAHRFSGSSVDLDIWINIESGIGIVCTCLPILRPLFRVILPRSFLARFSHDSVEDGPYKLTNKSNIRGKLRRIPSDLARENEPVNQDDTLGSVLRRKETGSVCKGPRMCETKTGSRM